MISKAIRGTESDLPATAIAKNQRLQFKKQFAEWKTTPFRKA
jgi:hypothetical protein